MLGALKSWAESIKRDVLALWLATRDPRTPWSAKIVALVVVGYALSPIDLIPDFIPVLGYLDDLILVPLGVLAAIALVPPELMGEFRKRAGELRLPSVSRVAGVVVVLLWLVAGVAIVWAVFSFGWLRNG